MHSINMQIPLCGHLTFMDLSRTRLSTRSMNLNNTIYFIQDLENTGEEEDYIFNTQKLQHRKTPHPR